MTRYILAIDQGTTSSRAMLFDKNYQIVGIGQREFAQHYPASGWVEHDPEDIWTSVVATCKEALAKADATISDVAAIGITNQRETTVIWDRKTGKPIHNAVVWQDRRTSETTRRLKAEGNEDRVTEKTGLLLDPYFSGSKVEWVLDHVEGARSAADKGDLAFGTIDTFLIWRLTGGTRHVTDATNACRTLLYDIHHGRWSSTMCNLFNVPQSMLPQVLDSSADFGMTDAAVFGASVPIYGVAGDQQAATVGQACFSPGMIKSTYGTGCFAVLNTGSEAVSSHNRLLTTIAYQIDGKVTYAIEGSIFVAGAAVQWLRDGLKCISHAEESGPLAAAADDRAPVYLVPAFVGLGAPYWDPDCRGAIFGLARDTGPKEITRAALESVCFQTFDLLDAMRRDWTDTAGTVLRVDGGMVASEWTMQRLADILAKPIDRPKMLETTALGAAYLAGRHMGFYGDLEEFSKEWVVDREFIPSMPEDERLRRISGWRDAVSRTLTRPAA
ncbi:MAG: glycerol kinase GlpK [Pseudomonadota bacterium]